MLLPVIIGFIHFSGVVSAIGTDCLCANVNVEATSETGHFRVIKDTCEVITDRVRGAATDQTWYAVTRGNQTGWILGDSRVKIGNCGSKNISCTDIADNCATIKDVCSAYKLWSFDNCRKFCNQCHIQPTFCVDKQHNCPDYGKSVCTNYSDWANETCRKFCGFCGEYCLDKLSDCASYGRSACTRYPQWALVNCQKFCNLCDNLTTTTTPAPTTTTPPTTPDGACRDQSGIDCSFMDSQLHVCQSHTDASQYCPKYCGLCNASPPCKDQGGIDCKWMDEMTHVCKSPTDAKQYCPKYCKVCGAAHDVKGMVIGK